MLLFLLCTHATAYGCYANDFVYARNEDSGETVCMRGLFEPLLLVDSMGTKIWCASPNVDLQDNLESCLQRNLF